MQKQFLWLIGLGVAAASLTVGCATNSPTTADQANPADTSADTTATGTLEIRANGEDFVRQGFTSKDGWKITFDHVYVTLAEINAYQTDPPYDAESDQALQAKQSVTVEAAKTIDLAAGDASAEPVLVTSVQAPAGRYNALSWKMPKARDGQAANTAVMLVGTAEKAGDTVPFVLKVDQAMGYQCGEFVGEQRKGNLTAGGTTELEATFHFDHLFGDAETPMTDELNQQALGFEPLAAIAQNGKVEADLSTLKQSLSPKDFETFLGILPSLGHVGEGHCKETTLAQR